MIKHEVVPNLKFCCCCFDLRSGVITLAVFKLLVWLLIFSFESKYAIDKARVVSSYKNIDYHPKTQIPISTNDKNPKVPMEVPPIPVRSNKIVKEDFDILDPPPSATIPLSLFALILTGLLLWGLIRHRCVYVKIYLWIFGVSLVLVGVLCILYMPFVVSDIAVIVIFVLAIEIYFWMCIKSYYELMMADIEYQAPLSPSILSNVSYEKD